MRWTQVCPLLFSIQLALLLVAAKTISHSSSLIFYHGRWDSAPSSWWPGSGFKLAFSKPPQNLTINLGANFTTSPAPVSARFGESGEWVTLNLTAGANVLDVTSLGLVDAAHPGHPIVFNVVTQSETSGRIQLESVEVDAEATLTAYEPKKLAFEFIGDSLTAGYLSPRGVVDDYSFKVGDYFNAEHNHIAQSGACLTDVQCFVNPHGMSYLYFQTQNSIYILLNGNVTTPWNFNLYKPQPSHIFINLGTNDLANGINGTVYVNQYVSFIDHLRTLYPKQPIFIIAPWGHDLPTGVVPYLQEPDKEVANSFHGQNVFLVNTTGWIGVGDTYPDYTHPTPNGHTKIAYHLIDWLLKWGLTVD